ncbi:rhodopsin, G0-coupled isoform X1 [Patella vulgata]|uniref:rhodopsin, G0-coupled isoform X1 n=2 Tax=Patella vulgata TaxID=6465 RepID=UPI00217F51F9|nr:rhodopsin, G0-coupled isoform X1 [Patella vulgata]
MKLSVIATVGNLMVLTMFCREKQLRRKPHNLLLLNLAIADIGISVFGYPMTTASNFAKRYLFGTTGCMIQGFATFTLAQTDMNTLACLSAYRYISVCKPQYIYKLDIKFTKWVIAFMWIYSIIWTAPPLFGWSSYTFEPFGTSCSIDWANRSTAAVVYTWCLVVFCYLLHVFIMIFCYTSVCTRAKEIQNSLEMSTIKPMGGEDITCCKKLEVEKHVTWICLLMTGTFTILWSPYTFVCLWSVYDANLPIWITTWPTMFAKASCMINPIIYYLSNPLFRKCAGRLLSCQFRHREIVRPRYRYRVNKQSSGGMVNRETNQVETHFL